MPPVEKPPVEKPKLEPQPPTTSTRSLVAKQLDDGGSFKILPDGMAEIKGKGRFYIFKKDEQSALAKREEYLWKPSLEVSCDIAVS